MPPTPSRIFVALVLGIGWGLSGPLYADWPQLGRRGESERVLALSARNGETLWTYEYPAPLPREILTRVMFTKALRIDGHDYASAISARCPWWRSTCGQAPSPGATEASAGSTWSG